MPSKFATKQPKRPEKQIPILKKLSLRVAASAKLHTTCTDCGAKSVNTRQHSKCICGGTFQRIKSTKE